MTVIREQSGVDMVLVKKMNLRQRLAFLVVSFCVIAAVVGIAGLYGMAAAERHMHAVYENGTKPMEHLSGILVHLIDSRAQVLRALQKSAPEAARERADRVERSLTEIEGIWAAFVATPATVDGKRLAAKLDIDRQRAIQQTDGCWSYCGDGAEVLYLRTGEADDGAVGWHEGRRRI